MFHCPPFFHLFLFLCWFISGSDLRRHFLFHFLRLLIEQIFSELLHLRRLDICSKNTDISQVPFLTEGKLRLCVFSSNFLTKESTDIHKIWYLRTRTSSDSSTVIQIWQTNELVRDRSATSFMNLK